MANPLDLRFLLSAPDADHLPPTVAEVAVAGRSNVGKSSLINALTGRRKDVAKVSKTPGRTQLLNLFDVDPDTRDGTSRGTLVDLPGYGYAAVPGRIRATWGPMIEGYLENREQLVMIMLLVDGEIGPTKLDLQMLGWMRGLALPHSVIATKHDKVKASVREKRKRELAEACQLQPGDVVWVSAAKNVGIDRLRDLVRLWLSLG